MANRKRKKQEGRVLPVYTNPKSDKDIIDWWENETNGSAIVRMLIRQYIRTGMVVASTGITATQVMQNQGEAALPDDFKRDIITENVMTCIDNYL